MTFLKLHLFKRFMKFIHFLQKRCYDISYNDNSEKDTSYNNNRWLRKSLEGLGMGKIRIG